MNTTLSLLFKKLFLLPRCGRYALIWSVQKSVLCFVQLVSAIGWWVNESLIDESDACVFHCGIESGLLSAVPRKVQLTCFKGSSTSMLVHPCLCPSSCCIVGETGTDESQATPPTHPHTHPLVPGLHKQSGGSRKCSYGLKAAVAAHPLAYRAELVPPDLLHQTQPAALHTQNTRTSTRPKAQKSFNADEYQRTMDTLNNTRLETSSLNSCLLMYSTRVLQRGEDIVW